MNRLQIFEARTAKAEASKRADHANLVRADGCRSSSVTNHARAPASTAIGQSHVVAGRKSFNSSLLPRRRLFGPFPDPYLVRPNWPGERSL